MKHSNFVHLHLHTDYSLLDGACRIDDIITRAAAEKMPALAITDHGNMFGVIEFYQKAVKSGIKPIIGSEVYVAPGSRFDKKSIGGITEASYHLVLLIQNEEGYNNLKKLSTIGYTEGFYYRPRVDIDVLYEHRNGLIVLSGCVKGKIPYLILHGEVEEAKKVAAEYKELFGKDHFYLELQDHGLEDQMIINQTLIQISRELDIPIVATNDCHYLKREDYHAHDVLLCIQTNKDLDDPDRLRFSSDQIYFKSPQEMTQLFIETPEAIANTIEIAEKCNLTIEFGKTHLPFFPLPDGYNSADQYLETLATDGLKQRYPEITTEVESRFKYELQTIQKMGYSSYFLIIKDLIDTAKKKDIPVGPGRGSVAGSIVAYALGITEVDPLKYNLLFERFLNPERVSMPDIDIDFCYKRRDEIIYYVIEKYGKENVTQIITFGTMAARAAIRDVGRVLKIPYSEVDRLAKLVPPDTDMTLEKAISTVPQLHELVTNNKSYSKLFSIAQSLEGLARHASIHAAGVVIAPGNLVDFVPLFKTNKNEIVTQYSMQSIESIGLLKIDFLGLRTLTVIHDTLDMLQQQRNIKIELNDIPLDDSETFKLIAEGQTVGVFQLESAGMRELLRKLKPQTFEDIIAVNALYRPGPLGSDTIQEFINRKHGRKKIKYEHPSLEPILKDTYGIILYQEHVVQIASTLAGFTLGQADLLRRAMGKKKADVMDEQGQIFIKKAVQRGIKKSVAEKIFNLIAPFAGYGFNRCHSTAYALVSYQTAYLKTHYPKEFMAALLTSEMGDSNRIVTLIDECKRMGIDVLPPDVNESWIGFTVVPEGIRFGLVAVKNVGEPAIDSIVSARERYGRFRTLFDFCMNLDLRLVNKRVIESLIQAGALDSLEGNRAQKIAAIEHAFELAQQHKKDREKGQTSLFSSSQETLTDNKTDTLPDIPEWQLSELLAKEKEMLGFYVSGHPLDKYRYEIDAFATATTRGLEKFDDENEVRLAGIISTVKFTTDRKGKPMAFLTLEDFAGTVEMLIFADTLEKCKELIKSDSLVFIRGRISTKEKEKTKLVITNVNSLSEIYTDRVVVLHIRLPATKLDTNNIKMLKQLLAEHPGDCEVFLHLKTNDDQWTRVSTKNTKVTPSNTLTQKIEKLVGKDSVRVGKVEFQFK